MEIEKAFDELLKFSDSILILNKPIFDNRIEMFEKEIGFLFADDFKYFIKRSNGFSLSGCEVIGIGKEFLENSLDKIYIFEHSETSNPMPKNLLPFSPDGFGNYYCLNLSEFQNGFCPVIFWQHDFIYDNANDAEICNESFLDWFNEVMIGWNLESYNYDGSAK